MRRFRIVPAMAILACLTMGADNPVASASAQENTRVAPAPAPLRRTDAPDSQTVRAWCSNEERGILELASSIQTRRVALDEREQLLDLREAELDDAEKRIVERLEELKKLRTEIDDQLKVADTQKEDKIAELVKMVESNRASSISGMFEALDEALAVKILDQMSASKAGKLLAALGPQKAATLAEKMSQPIPPELLKAYAAEPEAAPEATPAPEAVPAAAPAANAPAAATPPQPTTP